ncbi:MAG: YhcH/YjgK/YiaL family protein [Ignavibacteriales bacterium]|nr:YhcH/YjgK/YiaL family protein [Ignavibacteriales bacterium]
MIIDKIKNAYKYYRLHPGFATAFEYVVNNELIEMEAGSYEVDKKNVYCMVSNKKGRKKEESKLEFHRNYVDIQIVLNGTETIGWKSVLDCHQLERSYDETSDMGLYSDTPVNWLTLKPGTFAIFFPEDAHSPMVADDFVHKAVLKVAL